MKKKEQQDVVKEAKILRKVDHKNIIRSYAHFIEDDCLNIIMEYADNGDLQQLINKNKEKNIKMSVNEVWPLSMIKYS